VCLIDQAWDKAAAKSPGFLSWQPRNLFIQQAIEGLLERVGMKLAYTFRNLLAGAALVAGALLALPATPAYAQVAVQVGIAPPPIPVYEQPVIPGDGYIWTPGYWAWNGGAYVWVDGAWVYPPYVDALWTPGWWGWGGGGYFWHAGCWGRTIGYYGGINYGFGYFGVGFYGGYWNGGRFYYNHAYGHFGPGFHGAFYNHPYSGFSGRPGGASFNAHPPAQYAGNHGGAGFNHGSTVNGAYHGSSSSISARGGTYNSGAASSHAESRAPSSYNGGSHAGYSAPASHPSGGGGGGSHGGGGGHR